MRRRITWSLPVAAALGVVALYTTKVLATPSSGFVGTTIAVGRFGEIDVFNNQVVQQDLATIPARRNASAANVWLSLQKTKGLSDLYVQNNVWAPGGSTGWHTHPGHSLIIVTEGTVTAYDGDDPTCAPKAYTQGMGFVDAGGDHVHLLRNEGSVEARTVAVQLIPADAVRRVDAPSPGNCSF
jgi:quercetin dioxygenase-like cupin family protein